MTAYLDITGLTYYKSKEDAANDIKFLKNADFDQKIAEKMINVYKYKGTKASYDELPKSGNTAGDVYDVAGGMNYAWDGTKWDALGESKVEITIDTALSSTSTNPVQNKVINTALATKAGTATATTETNGLMSSTDKQKLEDISSIQNDAIDLLFV